MIVASGTRRGSALSTPSTSVQMTISDASSSAPKIEAEKSLPLRPSVVCRPSRVARDEAGDDERHGSDRRGLGDRRWRGTPPRGRWAQAAPGRLRRCLARRSSGRRRDVGRGACRYVAKSRVDQISPNPATRSRTTGDATRIRRTVCRMPAMSRQSAMSASTYSPASGSARRVRAMPTCRNLIASSRSASPSSLRFGASHERQQGVRDAATRGQHRRDARGRIVLENPRDPLHAGGVRHARPAELVHLPVAHVRIIVDRSNLHCGRPRPGAPSCFAIMPAMIGSADDPASETTLPPFCHNVPATWCITIRKPWRLPGRHIAGESL